MAALATDSYASRRDALLDYFDRTAADAWRRLTSDAPVNRIRATVRAGRDEMRRTLLSWLPDELAGARVLDAGCGTGAFAVAAAGRGAHVVAVDLSQTLTSLARQRLPANLPGTVEFRVGDMHDQSLGRFDFVVAMDSVIHYRHPDAIRVLAALADRTDRSLLFTFAPRTPALGAMHAVGRLFPRGNRSPAIEPVGERMLRRRLGESVSRTQRIGRTHRVARGFYISQALEVVAS